MWITGSLFQGGQVFACSNDNECQFANGQGSACIGGSCLKVNASCAANSATSACDSGNGFECVGIDGKECTDQPKCVCAQTAPQTQTPASDADISGQTGGGTIGCREGQDCVKLTNPLSTTSIPKIIGNMIQVVLGIIGSITLVVFLYGGFLWLTSAGNSEKIAKGLQAMLWATIGIIVVFSSYAILTLILQTLQASPN